MHVRLLEDACCQGDVHALQGDQAPDGEGSNRRDHCRGEVLAVRGPAAAREDGAEVAGMSEISLSFLEQMA